MILPSSHSPVGIQDHAMRAAWREPRGGQKCPWSQFAADLLINSRKCLLVLGSRGQIKTNKKS